jgi:DNA-binding CsgD family transcriptional regulator/tetratricopeptide (TPR) repeat protein
VELLEREGALASLAEAHASAAEGHGRAVLVTGEPGIGKTSLVTQFVGGLDAGSRVLYGTCDDLSIPRPLGPLRDLVGGVSPALEQALATGAAPHDVQTLLIAELELPPRPTVLVLEDVHWADDATFDSITVLGRRIGSLPALLVLTFRAGEVAPGHPLLATVGAIRADDSVVLELAPLSETAVASLAGEQADEVYAASSGNPFYVTELLAPRSDAELPPSVANAVLGRAARLEPSSRRLVELVSVVPNRVGTSLLDAVMPDWPEAAEEPERRQLLEIDPQHVRFRHELARNAIRSSIPIAARRRLHAEILDVLLTDGADPAEIVHHAEAAGAETVVADYALVAARRAAALGSNRQAYFHYRRASAFVDRLLPPERATMLEELARAAYAVDRLDDAFPAVDRAVEEYRALGDAASVGRCTQLLSRFHWFAGDGRAARQKALEAIEILEPLGESVELARAYSGLSQLENLEEENRQALVWGERARELATRLGDDATLAHVLVNVGSVRLDVDHRETAPLLEAHAFADSVAEHHEAARALGNLGYALMSWAQPEHALRFAERGLEYAEANEMHNLASYIAVTIAWLRLRAGEWDEAERMTRREIEKSFTVAQLVARTVLAELAVRRGDPDAAERLAELAAPAVRASEPQRIVPVLELELEWALTRGTPMPLERLGRLLEEIPLQRRPAGWGAVRVAACAAVAGVGVEFDPPASEPYASILRRDWAAAADAFGDAGWTYDRALMLSLLDDEEALLEALEIARSLGAEPLAGRAARRLRELGVRVPQGPRVATRANPAGLTPRQLEVLALVVEGLTNAEIAERLVVSPRTAEHHVAAVLTKLGAVSRRDAARRASELRLLAYT